MKKFMVIYHMPADVTWNPEDHSPEEMKKGQEQWMAWADRCGEGLVDMGSPLMHGQKLSASGKMPSESGATGYSILQAEDMDAAMAMVDNHPHLTWNEACELEVHEMTPMK